MEEIYDQIKELIAGRRFGELRTLFEDVNPADIAILLEELPEVDMILAFRILHKETAAETFVEMSTDVQETLISSFSDKELRDVFKELFIDDTVDIIEEMPANVVKRILKNSDSETRAKINEILNYPEDSAGSMMTPEYIALRPDMRVDEAFAKIRKIGVDKETIYTCYVTNYDKKLLGVVTVKSMLLASYEDKIGDIMEENVISVITTDDKELVVRHFDKYDFLALPVVDTENRLVGIVTVDDAMDVLKEEAEADFEVMAAITPDSDSYLKIPPYRIWLNRFPWLLLLMLSATFTGMIITSFENSLSACVVLTAFIPMLMGTGGNSGSQSSVTVIRGLSLGEIEFSDTLKVLLKELIVSLLCGISLAAISYAKIILIDGRLLGNEDITGTVALVVSLALFATVVCAKTIGCVLPILAKRLNFDPAVMASPFITTIVDALSLIVYFAIASSILGI